MLHKTVLSLIKIELYAENLQWFLRARRKSLDIGLVQLRVVLIGIGDNALLVAIVEGVRGGGA